MKIAKTSSSKHHAKADSGLNLVIGTNSIGLLLIALVCTAISLKGDVLNWSYLKGLSDNLSFFIGFFSIIFGLGFYSFWRLGQKSVYLFHFSSKKHLPYQVNVLYEFKETVFGISRHLNVDATELPKFLRQLLSMFIIFNVAIVVLDNVAFEKLKTVPSNLSSTGSEFCPDTTDKLETEQPKAGCELIIRAYKLGYAKSLGQCEPKKVDPEKLKVCEKRRSNEPYLHYMWRLLTSSIKSKLEYFNEDKVKEIQEQFKLRLNNLEDLKDFQAYAVSASPRASHHIWTNLPYPENVLVQKYREYLQPNYCIERFQNQTNTIHLAEEDERKNSKLFEHVYGQLLFNPKSDITVGFCKEYTIHWGADPDTCNQLAADPESVLAEEGVLDELELVLKRHDTANSILSLDEAMQKLAKPQGKTEEDPVPVARKAKGKIIKNKIAKAKQQIRRKNEIVSFQCFMEDTVFNTKTIEDKFTLRGSEFSVRSRTFRLAQGKGESQIQMYNELSKLLDSKFYYSQLSSRTDRDSAGTAGGRDNTPLDKPLYLLSRLEILKTTDIFSGNSWILEREDLLDLYPYHVHLQNYVKSFRNSYKQSRGRL